MWKYKISKYYKSPYSFIIGILSLLVSWYSNHNLGLLIIHYLISPFYLLYSLLNGKFADGGFMEIINNFF